jgi:hypothetical protein
MSSDGMTKADDAAEHAARKLAAHRRVEEAQRTFDHATAVMERTANRVIERVIRQGYVDRNDVRKLRTGDALCRRALEDLNTAKGVLRGQG